MGTSPFQMSMGTDGVAVFDGQPVILVEKTDFINETRNIPFLLHANITIFFTWLLKCLICKKCAPILTP